MESSKDIYYRSALLLPLDILSELCQNNSLYSKVCSDQNFWKQKVENDYPEVSPYIRQTDYKILYERLTQGYIIGAQIRTIGLYPYYFIYGRKFYPVLINGSTLSSSNPDPMVQSFLKIFSTTQTGLREPFFIDTDLIGKLRSKPIFVMTRDGWAIIQNNTVGGEIVQSNNPTGPVLAYYEMWIPDFNLPFDQEKMKHSNSHLPDTNPELIQKLQYFVENKLPLIEI